MSLPLNTNIGSLQAQRAAYGAETGQRVAMQRLSSGLRLNRASDDAAGLAVAARMSDQVRGLGMALRNAQDGLSVARTAEAAMDELQHVLQRMRELALQSANGTYTDRERAALNEESAALLSEIRRIATGTRWDRELSLLDGSQAGISVQAGLRAGETIVVPLESLTPLALGFTGIETLSASRPLNSFVDGHDGTFQVVTYEPPSYVGSFVLRIDQHDLIVPNVSDLNQLVSGLQAETTRLNLGGRFDITAENGRVKLTWFDRKGPQDRGTLTRTGDLTYPGNNTLGKIGTAQVQTFEATFDRDYQLTVGNITVQSAGAQDLGALISQLSGQLPADAGFSLSEDAGRLKLLWQDTGPQLSASLNEVNSTTVAASSTVTGISGRQIQVFDTVFFDGRFSLTLGDQTYMVENALNRDDLINKFRNLPGYDALGFEILSNAPARSFKLVWKTDGAQPLGTLVRNGPFPYGAAGANGILERTAVQKLDPGVYSGDFTLTVQSTEDRFKNYLRSLSVTGVTDRADLIAKLEAANVALGEDPLFTLTDTPPSITLTWNTIGFRPQAVLTRDGVTRSTGNQPTGNNTPWAVQKFEIANSAYGPGQDIELIAGGNTVLIEDVINLDDLIQRLNDPETLKNLPVGVQFYREDTRLAMVWDNVANQGPVNLKINGDTLRILTVAESLAAIPLIDAAQNRVNSARAQLGAAASRIEHLAANLMNLGETTRAARSAVEDADIAAESARLATASILGEASTAMLAQANQSRQFVLNLLQPRND